MERERCWSIYMYVSTFFLRLCHWISFFPHNTFFPSFVIIFIIFTLSTPIEGRDILPGGNEPDWGLTEDNRTDNQTIYLPPPSLRQTVFSSPPQDAVDYRAVCFCHGEVVDIGFVCSVCLSSEFVFLETREFIILPHRLRSAICGSWDSGGRWDIWETIEMDSKEEMDKMGSIWEMNGVEGMWWDEMRWDG